MRPGQGRPEAQETTWPGITGYAVIERLSSVSCDLVNGGDHPTAGAWPGIRAAVNTRLEEVSFRTGLMAGAATLLVLAGAAAAVVLTMMPSQGSPVDRAAGAGATVSSPVAAVTVPVAAPTRVPRRQVPEATTRPSPTAAAAAPAAAAPPAVPPSQSSPDLSRHFSARAPGRGAPGGHWPGRWTGSGPGRFGGTRGFTGVMWRPVPLGRPGLTRR